MREDAVERVAQAIYGEWAKAKKASGTWEFAVRATVEFPGEFEAIEEIVSLGRAEARAAIAEVMAILAEPTEEMIKAGEEGIVDRRDHGMGVFASDIWEAMLAASPLSEGDGR